RGIYSKMKVVDELIFMAELHGVAGSTAETKAKQWCERLAIADSIQKKVEELSKGMQQKIQFIAALMHEPDLIIMDEPFTGLDPVNTVLLKNVILELKQAGKSILFSTHQMEQVERMCDSILLINHGKAVLHGELREVKARYGRDTLLIEYEGDSSFLEQPALVHSVTRNGRGVEVQLAPGADPQSLLQSALPRTRLNKFELVEPS